jgi:dihydrofolate reductase
MRKLIVSEFITLDGVLQSPGYPDEDPSGGFEAGGWQQRYFDDVLGRAAIEGLAASGGLLLGRRTYEIFAGFWPTAPADDPLAKIINGLPKYVVSTTLQEPLPWANSQVLRGDVAQAVGELKGQDGGDLRVLGSGELVQTLMEQDLVDVYALMIHPLVVGGGKRLFRDGNPGTSLRLVESTTTSTGVLIVSYVPAFRPIADPNIGDELVLRGLVTAHLLQVSGTIGAKLRRSHVMSVHAWLLPRGTARVARGRAGSWAWWRSAAARLTGPDRQSTPMARLCRQAINSALSGQRRTGGAWSGGDIDQG